MTKYFFEDIHEDASAEEIQTFIRDFLDGELLPTLKSDPEPVFSSDPVKIVVGSTYPSIVRDPTTDVFMLFCTDSSVNCKKLIPIWTEIGEYVRKIKVKDVVVGMMDPRTNEVENV